MKIESGTLLFIGDSITDAGRARPVGEGGGLGGGYPSQVAALLGATYPERKIRVLNTGISGNTIRNLKSRWQKDVIDLKPDWLSIMIGTNDVWRQFQGTNNPDSVLPDEFEKTYNELILQTRPLVKGITLLTPFYIEPDHEQPMRKRMDEYGKLVRKIAKETGCRFGDTQAAYDKALQSVPFATLAGDKVHPSPAGHMVLSRVFLKTVDYRW
ncbi:SGNH/GDSL hydrolase family protein [Armatimonas rosea]|uniref:Lysophospholipase L1-like esterase n=1 Tax=Armatimonas rosea TaxID=685828 RepID=A0A7W9W8W6_ARMRO|nr:SGNH/GDSL hydrolase family protein [Armatimonas rosea]MBB6052022.1 lysophospholipase L1-like esterase [Armatimonas rosea]